MSSPPKKTVLSLVTFFTINAEYVKAADTDNVDVTVTATMPYSSNNNKNNNKTSKRVRFMKKKLCLLDSNNFKEKKNESEPDDTFVEKKEKDDEPNNKPVCFDEMDSYDKFWLCATYEPWVNHDKCTTDSIDIEGETYFINQICDECGDCTFSTNEEAKPFCDNDTDTDYYFFEYCRENKPICALLFDMVKVGACGTTTPVYGLLHYCGVDKEIENWMGKKFYWTYDICYQCGYSINKGPGLGTDHVNDPNCPEEVPKERESCVGDVRCCCHCTV